MLTILRPLLTDNSQHYHKQQALIIMAVKEASPSSQETREINAKAVPDANRTDGPATPPCSSVDTLDLVFAVDCTGSMGTYIAAAQVGHHASQHRRNLLSQTISTGPGAGSRLASTAAPSLPTSGTAPASLLDRLSFLCLRPSLPPSLRPTSRASCRRSAARRPSTCASGSSATG